jgi:RHS repeat-associated protein
MESGEKVDYSYDSLDRLTAEKRTDSYGQILAWDIYEYDLAGNRTRKTILDASGSTLLTVNYALATGNRLAAWNVPETNLMAKFPVAGAASEPIGINDRFGYLWVSNATAGGMAVKPEVDGTNFWTYDFTVGMGTQKIVAAIRDAAGNMGYATNTIIPVVVTNGAYQYSAAGCLTNISYKGKDTTKTLGLTWDGQYQLTAVATNGGVVESYKFDAAGRRVMTASAGVTNWHVYIDQHVIADLDSTGGVARTYMWGPGIDNLLAMTVYTNSGGTTSVSSVYYAIKDHLNSVLALTDSSGQIVEQYRYDAWGRTTVFDGNGNPLALSAVGNRYLWQGREYSWKTGLYNFRARWADPVTGRWLSNDPIGISGGLNQYVFCANNPVNFIDPFGLRDYSASQTRMILRNAVREYKRSSWGSALLQARQNHGFKGKYDYKINSPCDTFVVGGQTLAADQFGNYIAGFATYGRFGSFGETMTRLAGDWYELLAPGNEFWLDDPGSTEMISQGVYDFYSKYNDWNDLFMSDRDWQRNYNETMCK